MKSHEIPKEVNLIEKKYWCFKGRGEIQGWIKGRNDRLKLCSRKKMKGLLWKRRIKCTKEEPLVKEDTAEYKLFTNWY